MIQESLTIERRMRWKSVFSAAVLVGVVLVFSSLVMGYNGWGEPESLALVLMAAGGGLFLLGLGGHASSLTQPIMCSGSISNFRFAFAIMLVGALWILTAPVVYIIGLVQ